MARSRSLPRRFQKIFWTPREVDSCGMAPSQTTRTKLRCASEHAALQLPHCRDLINAALQVGAHPAFRPSDGGLFRGGDRMELACVRAMAGDEREPFAVVGPTQHAREFIPIQPQAENQ